MPTLLKSHFYRNVKNKAGIDVIPLENREVDRVTFCQYVDVTTEYQRVTNNEKNVNSTDLRHSQGGGEMRRSQQS